MTVMILFGVKASSKGSYFTTKFGTVKQKTFWRFEIIFPLFLFAIIFGMRYDVGVDYLSYLNSYLLGSYVGKNEILFTLLSDIGWKLNLHYTVYFGIIAYIQVFFFFYTFKGERYLFPFLVFFLFTNSSWVFWMNGIRQALAMCIWIFSLKYIEEKKLLKYVLWGIVAILFHKSATILLVFYPILRNGKDFFSRIPVQLILVAGAFLINRFFENYFLRLEPLLQFYTNLLGTELYESYSMEGLSQSFVVSSGSGLAYLFKIATNVIIILNSTRIKNFYNSKRFTIFYFFFFLGLLTSYVFPIGAIALTRPFRYFYIFQSIMYAYVAYYLFKTKTEGNRKIFLYGLIIAFLGIFFMSQITSNENSHLWYQFYYQQNIWGYPNWL